MQQCQRPLASASAVFNIRVRLNTFHDPERPEGLVNCTKDEVRGDLLRSPHKHLTHATVYIN